MVGESPAIRHLLRLVERVAPTDRSILICGPSGSGKEVIAQLVHHHGGRSEQPFVDLNCGAIPEHLVEAELFGHARGAFTGATHNRPGHFELAGKGTLFLDEIGELPLALQPKLLRVLETRTFRPVGSGETRLFEGRVVAATHQDLPALVRAGRFREDLYYRLAVFVLQLPGLDQRREDIPSLVAHFAAAQPRPMSFTPAALQRLSRQSWPGQVRQLRNLVDQLGVLSPSPQIDVDDLEPFLDASAASAAPSLESLADALFALPGQDKLAAAENLMIDRALQRSSGNKTAAAQLLGVNRKVVERRLRAREDHSLQARRLLEQGRSLSEASAFREAIPALRRCLDALAVLPPQNERRLMQFEAHRLLGIALRSVQGWFSAEARQCYEAALEAGEGLCDAAELASLQFGLWSTELMGLELARARASAQDMLQRAHASADPAVLSEAHVALANTLFWLGDSEETLACLTRSGLLAPERTRGRTGVQGFDLSGLALTLEGLAAFQTGDFGRSHRALARLEQQAREGGPAFDRAIALQGASWLACLFEDMERLGPLAAELATLAQENGFAFYQGIGQVFLGCRQGALGRHDEALRTIAEGYQNHMVCHGGRLFHSFQAWQRGELLLRAGRIGECEALVAHALEVALEHQERAYLGELLCVEARSRLAQGDVEGAEQGLRSAASTALALGSVPARLHATTHLARLLADSGRPLQAAEALSRAVRGLRDEGHCSALTRAQHLLARLPTLPAIKS